MTAPPVDSPVEEPAGGDGDGSRPQNADDGAMSRINLRMPDRLKARVENAAAGEAVSVNSWLVRAATAALERTDSGARRAGRDANRPAALHGLGALSAPSRTDRKEL